MNNIFLPKVSGRVNNIYAHSSAQLVQQQAGLQKFYFRQGKEMFLHFTVSKPSLRPTKTPVEWGTEYFLEGELSGRPLTHLRIVPISRKLELYLHSPVSLHGLVFI